MNRMAPHQDSVWDRLDVVLLQADPEYVVYVYRVNSDGQVQRPHLGKCEVTPDLLTVLQEEFGKGEYRLLIRRGRQMAFSGLIAIEAYRSEPEPRSGNLGLK
jgi:hypothetical protein